MPAATRVYYHITLQPHRRLPALYCEVEAHLTQWVAALATEAPVQVLAVGIVPNHAHLLVEKAPWADLLEFIRRFQAESSASILARFPELRRDMATESFWAPGFHYRRHTAASLPTVRQYIANQKKHHGLE